MQMNSFRTVQDYLEIFLIFTLHQSSSGITLLCQQYREVPVFLDQQTFFILDQRLLCWPVDFERTYTNNQQTNIKKTFEVCNNASDIFLATIDPERTIPSSIIPHIYTLQQRTTKVCSPMRTKEISQYRMNGGENGGYGKPDTSNDIPPDAEKRGSASAFGHECASLDCEKIPATLQAGPSSGSKDLSSPTDASSLMNEGDNWPEKTSLSENGLLNVLRLVLFLLLISITVLVSVGVYTLTSNDEENRFEDHVGVYSLRIIDSFHGTISHRLSAIGSMATAITSHAISTSQQFPMVTLPHFELRGSDLRVQTDSFIIHYMPVVNESMRTAWEEYALQNRGHIDEAFQSDTLYRKRQDEEMGFDTNSRYLARNLQPDSPNGANNLTVLADGTGFHPRIWSNGGLTPEGDEPIGQGYYLPLWQRR